MEKILVIGANGQLGTELVTALRNKFGDTSVIASDIRKKEEINAVEPYVQLDAMDREAMKAIIEANSITQVYHLAAILSAVGESKPVMAWDLNMTSLLNVLELAKDGLINRVFWPSSIAVFGPDSPKSNTPQFTVMNPNTVYGISKLAGERWCEYYHQKYGVDVRSVRYPGLIGYKSLPGGGTTDYAVDIFWKALKNEKFECFLSADTMLPMMYMEDAVKATIDLMDAAEANLTVRSSYNIAGISFTPAMIYESIARAIPSFEIDYQPDYRQKIADSWPFSIDDTCARHDWQWQPKFDLEKIVDLILTRLPERLNAYQPESAD
ncbi:MAG: NAD-dependent epimerase/dehydratase family protein [Cyclobacteriaceae bacterium]